MSTGQCYGCFTDATYQYHGATQTFQNEIQRYIDALRERHVIKCVTCQRKVHYLRKDGKWHEEVTK